MSVTRELSWHKATRAQLCEIAYNDVEAPLKHRLSAASELKRRARRKHGRVNYKAKEVYAK